MIENNDGLDYFPEPKIIQKPDFWETDNLVGLVLFLLAMTMVFGLLLFFQEREETDYSEYREYIKYELKGG